MFFKNETEKIYDVEAIASEPMDEAVNLWLSIWQGAPPWVTKEIKTVGFAKAIASETARLATLDIDIKISGGRSAFLQEVADTLVNKLRVYSELACAAGGVMLKPNGLGVDCLTPLDFAITDVDADGNIRGAIFIDRVYKGDKYYKRFEYHRFEGEDYKISNRAYVSDTEADLGKDILLDALEQWAHLEPEVIINGVEKPLFSYFKIPDANNIDPSSSLGVAIYSNAIQELQDLDIAYSRFAQEVYDSRSIELIDDRLIENPNEPGDHIDLPSYVRKAFSTDTDKDFYQHIDRPLKTTERKSGIDILLSFIGYKCGYSNGYFSFDGQRGFQTATQVEADDQRTIQLIKDIRDKLKYALTDLFEAVDITANSTASSGTYKIDFDFGDITYNYEEDRQHNYQLASQNIIPWWLYLVKFEGYSEEEAKKVIAEARSQEEPGLFNEYGGAP